MKNQPASPAKIAAMIAGVLAVLAFAYWNISRTLAPSTPPAATTAASTPPAATKPAAPKIDPSTGLAPGKSVVTEAKGNGDLNPSDGTEDMIARTPAAIAIRQRLGLLAPAQQADAPPLVPVKPVTGEAALAPGADPFVPYLQPPAAAGGPGAPPRNWAPPAGVPAAAPGGAGAAPLPGFAGSNTPGGPLLRPGPSIGPAPAVAPPPAPELAGTLLGDRPCAVFRADKQLATVPVGGSFNGWKVVRVEDGEAIVKRANMTTHLYVGMAHGSSSAIGPAGGVARSEAGQIAMATPEEARRAAVPDDITTPTSPNAEAPGAMQTGGPQAGRILLVLPKEHLLPANTARLPIYSVSVASHEPDSPAIALRDAPPSASAHQRRSRLHPKWRAYRHRRRRAHLLRRRYHRFSRFRHRLHNRLHAYRHRARRHAILRHAR